MASVVGSSDSEAYIMLTFSKKEKQLQQQAKNSYWQKELDDKEELQNLSDSIKQAMFQAYKLAYGDKGDTHTEEAKFSTGHSP
jgi:hypothetical protein